MQNQNRVVVADIACFTLGHSNSWADILKDHACLYCQKSCHVTCLSCFAVLSVLRNDSKPLQRRRKKAAFILAHQQKRQTSHVVRGIFQVGIRIRIGTVDDTPLNASP